jgi:hypothetical protein
MNDEPLSLDLSLLHSPDARAVLTLIYNRMLVGEAQYGLLDLSTDKRDFLAEGLEEQVDRAVYEAMYLQQRILKGL